MGQKVQNKDRNSDRASHTALRDGSQLFMCRSWYFNKDLTTHIEKMNKDWVAECKSNAYGGAAGSRLMEAAVGVSLPRVFPFLPWLS